MRKLILSCLGCLALTLLVAPSAFAHSAEVCEWGTTDHFTPGLGVTPQPFSYNFTGQLAECKHEVGGFGEGSGNLEAGQTFEQQVENSTTHFFEFVTFAMPMPTGNGDCAASTTSGTALVSWPDGSFTVVSYSTTGGVLSGEVVPSMTVPAVNPQPGQPTSLTYTTSKFSGDEVHGSLEAKPTPATACATSTGATTAVVTGKFTFHN
jgi:hypothetical protein